MSVAFDDTYWQTDKIVTLAEATELSAALRQQGKRVVTVNGSFDVLHAGHLDQLAAARQQGDVVFVGLNSDASVRDGKGDNRPIVPEQARAAMLAALMCVDYVSVIDESYAEVAVALLRAVHPATHVNGPDYGEPETWLEWPVMQELRVEGHVITKRNDFSTSDLVKKIQNVP